MNKSLYVKIAVRLLLFFPVAGIFIFLPAGTLNYWDAWVFIAVFFASTAVVPGLDHRFRWSDVPMSVVVLGNLLVIISYFGFYWVLRENTYAAATIQVEKEQKVISTGPYAIVRHPMYSAALIMSLGIVLALGSWVGLLSLVPGIMVVVWRLFDEEKFLHKDLPGYTEYTRKVRWRLIPGIF